MNVREGYQPGEEWPEHHLVFPTTKYAQQVLRKSIVLSNHFNIRLFQRFDAEQRKAIFVELAALARTGMHQYLIPAGEDEAEVKICNTITMPIARKGTKIVLKTLYEPEVNSFVY